ncbi:unnamed protein product [Acanthoscelides obtectus]|uniref:Uncharacterized protein n=1 Tax=Acanthoscelides obtectus TaxID=200917 RepID=A0A9P0KYN7_ACAOB|nr:unnamed protein product [Acanthoscelides obtectus]CAK1637842.1 hypothetical protein AOBTE_LOCUS10225 [Acanthoscelides obtectus]
MQLGVGYSHTTWLNDVNEIGPRELLFNVQGRKREINRTTLPRKSVRYV